MAKKGFLIGKFMPPHKGHLYLIDRALEQVDDLTVMIFWLDGQVIPGPLRAQWLRELRPQIRVVECTDNHQVDFDNPDIWALWAASMKKVWPETPDLVFSSEPYGEELARRMGGKHIAIDPERKDVSISATQIREAPWAYWDFIPDIVRPYFVKKIYIVGGESTGKTTLAKKLAERFQTVFIEEYARDFLMKTGGVCKPDDMPLIAEEQFRREEAARKVANRFVFCDTNALVTRVWSNHYFKECHPRVESLIEDAFYLLLHPDIPWIDDGLRDTPNGRDDFFRAFKEELKTRGYAHAEIKGEGSDRLENAVDAVCRHFKGLSEPTK